MTTKLSESLRELLFILDAQLKPSQAAFDNLRKCIAQAEAHEQECEAMCGDHGGIEGCSCSECSTPLGPRELCAYCNGCGRRVKWPMSDGTEYRAPMSSEARDKAIEAGNMLANRVGCGCGGDNSECGTCNYALQAWDQALSALRK